jgi:hypothetical protein
MGFGRPRNAVLKKVLAATSEGHARMMPAAVEQPSGPRARRNDDAGLDWRAAAACQTLACRGRSPHAIRLLTTKPATGGDVIFAAFKKDADGYSRRHMDFKLLDRV